MILIKNSKENLQELKSVIYSLLLNEDLNEKEFLNELKNTINFYEESDIAKQNY